jgi:PAS domain S-box-containing protein
MSFRGRDEIRVLHVDDDPGFLDLVAEALPREHDALTVVSESAPEDALERVRAAPIDCVVSDFDMPGMDGLEFLEAVRARNSDLPFILFTGKGSEEIASDAVSAGVTDYLQKGAGTDQFTVLANRIRNAVQRHRTGQALQASRERYRRLVEQNIVGNYIVQDGQIRFANPKAAEVFGYARDEMMSLSVYDIVDESDHPKLRSALADREAGEVESMNYVLTGVRKSGERFEFEVHSGRIEYDGEPAVLGTLIDITDRRERERELERYARVMSTVADGVYATGPDGTYTAVNETLCRMVGYDREEIVGAQPEAFLREADIERADAAIRRLVSDPDCDTATIEVVLDSADGGRVPCEARISLLPAEDGEFAGTVGSVRDVSDRRERERALLQYRQMVNTVGDPVYTLDTDGTLTAVNDAAVEILGYDREELLGSHVSTVIPESHVERGTDAIQTLLRNDERSSVTVEMDLLPAQGAPIPCENNISILRMADGSFEGTVGVLRDITDRLERERTLGALHDATRELMAANNTGEVAIRASDTARDVIGMPLNGVFFHDEAADELGAVALSDRAAEVFGSIPAFERGEGLVWEVFETGEARSFEDVRDADGAYNPDTPVRSELILPLGRFGVFVIGSTEVGAIDEEERRLARVLAANVEAALDRAEREETLRARESELARQNDRLEEFASVVSHDLRNPLNVADSRLDLYHERGGEEHYEKAKEALGRMNEIIDDVLTLARGGESVTDPVPISLQDAATNAWTSLRAPDADLQVDTEGVIRADRRRVQRLLENLFRNAVEHGAEPPSQAVEDGGSDEAGQSVSVRVGDLPDGFYVADDGPGIPEAERDRVFESGYSDAEGGTGFGLAIVEQISEAHGWSVQITESEAAGARFEFTGVDPA